MLVITWMSQNKLLTDADPSCFYQSERFVNFDNPIVGFQTLITELLILLHYYHL
jgi:hypothetical protein